MNARVPTSKLTLANKITIIRILSVPVFVLLLIYYIDGLKHGEGGEYYRVASLLLFVLVSTTDALDGYFARSRNEVTRLGRVLDPLADKSLVLSALILLTRPSLPALEPQFPIWFTTLVISRDVVSVVGSILVHYFVGSVEIRPRVSGKLATVMLMLAVIWILAQAPATYFQTMILVTGFLTLVSGLQYVFDGVRQLEKASTH